MARQKRSSKVLEGANRRATGLASINANLDLGGGLTLASYRAAIGDTKAKLDAYNENLSSVDALLNAFQASERTLRDLHERMLTGVATKHGKDSDEYEKAGGVRKSERKRPVRKPAIK
ncbi:MAG: hypothetical protein HY906_12425 [Deltaproteobacteria bacterium]|nr:hypothetical protein [Deltaproteobacteria bacterium]